MTTNGFGLVLVVEDDGSVRRATQRILRLSGFDTVMFASGEELLDGGRVPEKASCLLIDVQLPGMSGFALRDRLAESGPIPPVIFMTAFDDDLIRARVKDAAAAGFLSKPFTGEALLEAIAAATVNPAQKRAGDQA